MPPNGSGGMARRTGSVMMYRGSTKVEDTKWKDVDCDDPAGSAAEGEDCDDCKDEAQGIVQTAIVAVVTTVPTIATYLQRRASRRSPTLFCVCFWSGGPQVQGGQRPELPEDHGRCHGPRVALHDAERAPQLPEQLHPRRRQHLRRQAWFGLPRAPRRHRRHRRRALVPRPPLDAGEARPRRPSAPHGR